MESKADQYYPTYKYNPEHRDVLLIEFEEAQKIANGQTKVYGQVTNILLAIATFTFTFILDPYNKTSTQLMTFAYSNGYIFSIILFCFGAILLRYFVDLQKQITINARKVVTLRTLLGLDYGNIHLTLPNWRVKYFNGWSNFKTMPFWVLTITVNTIWWLTVKDKAPIKFSLLGNEIGLIWLWGNILITLTYLFVFRRNLNDRHETIYLNLIQIFCSIFRIKLVDNFEYIIYRAKLSYLELDRLKINYKKLQQALIDIEDIDFHSNYGISFKSLVRAFLSRFRFLRKKYGYIQHGGSTITMQLARSLFIPSNQNKYLRKISEILLSYWLNRQFSKGEILKLYIASVRYERGVLGLSSSMKYFFGQVKNVELTSEEAFFLVERLSNITSTVNWPRIIHLTKRTTLTIDNEKLKQIYEKQIKSGRLKKQL